MRVPTAVFAYKNRDARAPQKEHTVPFQEILPLRLKNRVSGKADSSSDVACLQEMGVLFACLKDNEFVEKYCNKEIHQFQKCYKFYADSKFEAKKTVNQGIITPGKNLNYKQLNKYMRRFPNPQ
ncbi:PREDICTED: coiled-coil-helix-coiled-coil-helix domain-containing protein 1 [Bactrocera latifrons]|uniref:Coiled-coil-helix-coiled-coil-helix domain-containing protein 1 n=1 Tax=Bactrocera latifrons TaxID=174628 RepID=A0A0K8VKI8_BACLA|nr:PREDICTED: coiled-coil-helix-coiled-coil-helix domain-containing protein 1 [Bactrocera latifrons]